MDRNARRRTPTKWKQEDNEELLIIVQQYAYEHPNSNLNWKIIAKTLNQSQSTNFTGAQCHQHYWRVVNPKFCSNFNSDMFATKTLFCSINRGEFTEEEDQLLLDLYESIGENRWSKISKAMEGRTDSQCRQRFLQLKAEMQKPSSKRVRRSTVLENYEIVTTSESPTSSTTAQSPFTFPSPQHVCSSESVCQSEIPVRKSEPTLQLIQTETEEDSNLCNQDFFELFSEINNMCSLPVLNTSSSPADVKHEIILEQRIDRVVGTGLTTLDKASLLPTFLSFSHETENSQSFKEAIQFHFPVVSVHEFEIPSQESQNTFQLLMQG